MVNWHHILTTQDRKGNRKLPSKTEMNWTMMRRSKNQMTSQETRITEKIKALKQQMAEMYEAWMSGQPPPSSIWDYFNTNMSHPIQVSTSDLIYPPGFGPYANTSNVAGTSMVRLSNTPLISNPLFVSTAPTNRIPQPMMVPKSNSDPPPKVRRDQSYTLEEAISNSSLPSAPLNWVQYIFRWAMGSP